MATNFYKTAGKGSSKQTKKFVMVHWIIEKTYSVEPHDSVMDLDMLTNPDLSGLVKYTQCLSKDEEPKTGWRKCPAKILASSGKHCLFVSTLSYRQIITFSNKMYTNINGIPGW